jgi:hypothetical protein
MHAILNRVLLVFSTALTGWVIPGGGYLVIRQYKRGLIVLCTIAVTFTIGLYVGSLGIVDPFKSKICFVGQILVSPFIAAIPRIASTSQMPVYGRPFEVAQIYTGVAGLLNLLCIINATYLAVIYDPSEKS